MKNLSFSLAVVAIAAITASASASVTNGGFSTDLSGWDTIGDVGFRNGTAFLTTASLAGDGGGPMLNYSGTDVAGSFGEFGVEGFANLADGALDPDPDENVFASEGSAIRQTFNILADQYFTFEWRFFTNSTMGNDYAFAVVNGDIFTLAIQSDATGAGEFSYNASTNLATFTSSTFLSNTVITLTLGVLDVDDTITSSALQVDNVTVVPEPASALLIGMGGLLVLLRRRR